MQVRSLGHVVLKVRDLARSEAFYAGVLGLPVATRSEELGMIFFTLGDHHDFAIAAVGADAPAPPERAPGLAHVAFKIGDDLETLRAARAELEAAGIRAVAREHGVSQSLYMKDPDGNVVEIYVDGSDAWKQDADLVARSDPLQL